MPTSRVTAPDPLSFSSSLPLRAGIGLRHPHVPAFLSDTRPSVAWLEVHSENYLAAGGPRVRALEQIRRDYPISFHGVGLSLGSAEGLSRDHLVRLKASFARFEPAMISDHLSWSVSGGAYLNDLLPLPLTEESLRLLCRNIDEAQSFFGRPMLVENPSSYLSFEGNEIPEWDFFAALSARTGCGLLLDVNNIYVSAINHGFEPTTYLAAVPTAAVEEIHLAGHFRHQIGGEVLLIDDHGAQVCDEVWQLYQEALRRFGAKPTLIEWDAKIPPLEVLLAEAHKAEGFLQARLQQGAPHVA